MKSRLAVLVTATALLAACGAPGGRGYDYDDYSSPPSYHATCTDRAGRILADWRCDSHYSGAGWRYEPYSTYQRHLRSNRSYYTAGRSCTCGTATQPKSAGGKPVGIQQGSKKTVTVFQNGKQVGNPIKLNQDAKKASTITSESRRDTAKRSSWGSYTRKSSSTNRSSSSRSYSSTSRRK